MKRKALNNKIVYTKVLPVRLLNESAKRAEEGQLVDTTYDASDVILLAGCCCMYADFPAAEKQTCCEVDYLQIGNLAEGLLGTIDYVASSLGILFSTILYTKTSLFCCIQSCDSLNGRGSLARCSHPGAQLRPE